MLVNAADCLEARAREFAELETRDTGKRPGESEPRMRGAAERLSGFGGVADKVEGRMLADDRNDIFNYTPHVPLGVVAAITPWNSPLPIAARETAPAPAVGNTIVVKPSGHVSASTPALMAGLEAAGFFPPGAIDAATGMPLELRAPLIGQPDVATATVTASAVGGWLVNRAAAEAVRHVTTELGGKSPQIVFEDVDPDSAVNGTIAGAFLSKAARARWLCGRSPESAGDIGSDMCIGPSICADLGPDIEIWRGEGFGPALAASRLDGKTEAGRAADDSRHGLAAGIRTGDVQRGHHIAKWIGCCTVDINASRVASGISPIGGFKQSGLGRESGLEAIGEYTPAIGVWAGLDRVAGNPFGQGSSPPAHDVSHRAAQERR